MPVGRAGTVNDTVKPGLACCNAAITWLRVALDVELPMAPPSTSKSRCLSEYWVMTFWYWACRALALEQVVASSEPAAPPKETTTSPPLARICWTSDRYRFDDSGMVPAQEAVQPPLSMMKASV